MCHFIQFCLFSQSYLYIFNNYLYIIIFIYILFHFIFLFSLFFLYFINLLIISTSQSYFLPPARFLAVHLSWYHASHSQSRSRIASPSCSLFLAQNCICRPCCAHSHHTRSPVSAFLVRSLALLRSSALLLSLDSRVTFGAEQSNCHKVRAVTVIACHMLQALPCWYPLSIHPFLHHSLPAGDPCRRHHHNKAVSCCSNSVALARKLHAPLLFVCLRFLQ